MIITRSPLRISLGGGGTDLPSYYREHTRLRHLRRDRQICLHHAARYLRAGSDRQIFEDGGGAASVEDVKHPIVREALKLVQVGTPHLEITSMADIPAGTGLGSSGSFTTALLRALHTHEKELHLAAGTGGRGLPYRDAICSASRSASRINTSPRSAASRASSFCRTTRVEVAPLQIPPETLHNLEDNLVLFFTGFTRSASEILNDQDTRSAPGRQRDDRQSALHQADRLRNQDGVRAGRSAALCRTDARALGA